MNVVRAKRGERVTVLSNAESVGGAIIIPRVTAALIAGGFVMNGNSHAMLRAGLKRKHRIAGRANTQAGANIIRAGAGALTDLKDRHRHQRRAAPRSSRIETVRNFTG